jgi:putative salt-induced outer membrane protein
MMRSAVRSLSLVLVAAPALVAQAPTPPAPPKPPYEFVADFSLAASQGNQEVTTVSLGQRYSYAFPTWKFSQTASALRGSANGVRNAELYQAGVRGDYNLTKKLTAFLNVDGLRNTPAGLNNQFAEGLGLAYQFTDTDTDKLQLSIGLGSLQRSFVGVSARQNDFVGNAAGLYRHLFSKVSYFEQTAGFTPNFTTSDAWLFTTKSSLVAPLSSKVGIKVAYLVNFNNAPPLRPSSTERFKKFDGQFTY